MIKKREAKALLKDNKKQMKNVNGKIHERTVDEIKDRYYAVAKAVLEHRG